MIYCCCLNFASKLDVILLVFLKDQPCQIDFRGCILSLDFFTHLLESNNHQLQNFLFLLVKGVLLCHFEVVFGLQCVNDFLHVFGQQEGQQRREFILSYFEGLNQHLCQKNNLLAAVEKRIQSWILIWLVILWA